MYLVRLRSLRTLADGVLHLLVLREGAIASHIYRGVMDEHVGRAFIGGNETARWRSAHQLHRSTRKGRPRVTERMPAMVARIISSCCSDPRPTVYG